MNILPNKNTLNEAIRFRSVELLNTHLAAAIDLHAQVKQAHWNVRGPNFIALHDLFDAIVTDVLTYTDCIAERAASLGGTAMGGIQDVANKSFLTPYPLGIADEAKHLLAVAGALASFGEAAREAIGTSAAAGDPGTANLFTEISRGIDQRLWLVQSHAGPR